MTLNTAFLYLLIIIVFCFQTKKKIVIRKLDMCKGQGKYPVMFSNATTSYNKQSQEMWFGVNIDVDKEVSNNFTMAFDFIRCDASGNPDSCEYVIKNYVNKEICKYMGMKNQAWTVFVDYVHPPLKCPIKPATYKLVNSPVKADFLRTLPIGDAVWKVTFRGYDNDVYLACVNLELQVIPFVREGRRG
ncbi:hypothetical protein NQ315_016891 [Exocentrus adspersus]|uniref:MD-2-related lipid-recognition domain-containing protein n=1 Tax=Exocentrus adspersus TaxID=1586481 RepID=A0AAV8VY42_9CUCU|nr:hypothetical protein NQ315_016891 [Exocentrus adspersus]